MVKTKIKTYYFCLFSLLLPADGKGTELCKDLDWSSCNKIQITSCLIFFSITKAQNILIGNE